MSCTPSGALHSALARAVTQPLPLADLQSSGDTLRSDDDESMKPPSNVKTSAQFIASLPADRAKTITAARAFVNKHIPRGYDECLVWGTIGWTIPLSRYPDDYNKQPTR
jgi:hypothetical protein